MEILLETARFLSGLEIMVRQAHHSERSDRRGLPHHNHIDNILAMTNYIRAKFEGGYYFEHITNVRIEGFGE
jgi:hypothetical protein